MKLRRILKAGLLLFCAVLGINAIAAPSNHEELGDKAYSRQQFDSAIVYYQEAIRADNSKAINWFKLGNSQYRMRHYGEAVLAYERCLERRPGFAEAADNVAHIQRLIQGSKQYQPIAIVQLWRAAVSPRMSNIYAWLALTFVAAPLLFLAFGRYKKSRLSWLRPQIVVGSVVLGTVLLILATVAAFKNKPGQIGVVMRQDAVFQEAISGGAKSTVINLPEGLLVKILSKKAAGISVILPDGRTGLIQRADITIVE